MEKNEGLFNVYFKADRVDYGKNGYESINLKNNPNLMSDSIYLYNLLFMNKPAFAPRDWEQHQVNFERYVMPRLTLNEQAIVSEWINTLHKNELLKYRSLEGMAKTYVTFHKLLKKITNEADQAFEDQFKDVQSLDQQSRKKTIDIYSFYHKISNEKTAESTKRLEAQVNDLLIKPMVNKGETSPTWFNDLVRAVMVLDREIESEKLKTKIFTEIKKSGNQPVLEEKWDSFIKNHAIPRLKKNTGLDEVYYELSQTINVLNKKIKVSVEEAQSVSSVFYNKIFPNLLRLPDMSHLEKIAIYEIYIDESNLLPKTKNKIKKTLEKNLLKKEKKKLEEVKLLKKQNIQMIEEIEPHDLLALEEIQRGKQKATVDFFTAIYKKYGALNRTTMTREKYLSEEVQRGKQKATGDLFTVIYEKNGALNRTAISREAKKYLSKVGYLEFEFIVHNSEQKNHIIKQESTSLSVLKSMLKRKDLSPYAVKAYCLAYLEERQLGSNIKKLWRKPFLKDLTPEEIKVVENLVSEKRLCLQLGKEVGPELAVRYERSNQDNQVERLKLFNEMDQKVFSVTCRQFIKEQAKKCLSATNYTRFEVAQMIRNIERKKGLQEREKKFFDPIINSQELSSNEIRAYCLAYLEEQQMESNIKKNLRKPFLKELKPEEILKVKNLVSEKRLYLQLGKEVGPELATKLDNSKESDQVVLSQLFKEIDQKAFSVTCRQFIKEQAKKCLSATNYTRFEVAQMIRNIERKKGLQEREKKFFDPIINSQELSSNEIRAYCLAYLEEQQMESNIKKNLRKPFLKELKPEEILKVKNLVSEKRLYLQLGKEVGPELATKLDNSKESDQVVLSQLFKEMDQKAFSVTCRQFIKEQAKKHLSEENYVRFEIGHVIREGESKKNLQEWEETDFLNPFLSRENLSPNEIRAYEIAYLEMKYEPFSQMNSWKKSLQQYFEKNLTSEERNEVQALVPQKRVLIQLSKELDLKNVFQLEEIQQGKQEGRLGFFTDIYEKSFSTTNQEYIKTQAKIYLSPANHAEFAVKSQMQDALREKGLKLANIKFSEDKIRVFLDQKTQSPLEIRAYYLACIEEQVIPMDIKKSLIHALKKVLTVDENLKLSELISEQQRLIHLSEEIGPERTLEFLKIKKENKAATIDFFTDLYNNVSSYTQQWIKEQASLHLNRKEHLEFTKKVKLKEIIKEGGPDLKASAVYNQRKRAFEKAMSLPVIEVLQVKNGLQQVNANLLDPLELRRLNKEQLIDSLVKVQVRFPHWEQRLKDQAIDRSISHLNDLEKKRSRLL